MRTIGDRLIELRGDRIQTQIADAAGISVSHLSGMESNRTASLKMLKRLANVYGISVTNLLEGTEYDIPTSRVTELEHRVARLEWVLLAHFQGSDYGSHEREFLLALSGDGDA